MYVFVAKSNPSPGEVGSRNPTDNIVVQRSVSKAARKQTRISQEQKSADSSEGRVVGRG